MPSLESSFPGMVDALADRLGKPEPSAWGLDSFEAVVASLLDLALDPRRRDRAVEALREEGLLEPQALAESDPIEVADALRSAGIKIQEKGLGPLQRVARWLVDRHRGDPDALADADSPVSSDAIRDELTAIQGVGPATADALLLFAFRRPVYPLDRPTYRILARHGWIESSAGYDEARETVEGLAHGDAPTLGRISLWFERVANDYCRASVAKCERCPLKRFLPEGGPVDPDS